MTRFQVITVRRDVQAAERAEAEDFRRAMSERGTLVVNVLSSPGSGKTSLLAATVDQFPASLRCGVLVGDIATDRDARRLASHVPVVQLTTGGACHLEFPLIAAGWRAFGEPSLDFLFLENIGNLVCPASHDLGEHLRILLLSTTEGDDKPAKYPKAFRTSHAMVISKIDLLPHVPFDVERAIADARTVREDLRAFPVSVRPPQGLDRWCAYLLEQRERLLNGALCRPNR